MASETNETREKSLNFLEEIIEESIAKGEKHIQTRFPPEPNGYLHIGSAKAIFINWSISKKYNGKFNIFGPDKKLPTFSFLLNPIFRKVSVHTSQSLLSAPERLSGQNVFLFCYKRIMNRIRFFYSWEEWERSPPFFL